jgi:hypothetical protein
MLIQSDRDLRIDFFRGLALWWIFVDHLTRSWLRNFTLQRLTFCDAAELFVLLSGISAGIAYGPSLSRHRPLLLTSNKVLRRVACLYRTHLLLFVLVTAEALAVALLFDRPGYLDELYLHPLVTDTYRSIFEVATLRFQPEFLDVLPLYMVLLLMFCLVLPLLRWPNVILSLSAALYVATRMLQLSLPAWRHGWYFNPLCWQFLFFIGVVAATTLKRWQVGRTWDVLAALVLAACIALSHLRHLSITPPQWLGSEHYAVDKVGLHPLRLVSILALAWLTWRFLPAAFRSMKFRLARPFVLMGQHSLVVFSAGIFLAIYGEVALGNARDWKSQILVNGLGTASLFAVAAFAAWQTQLTKAAASKGKAAGLDSVRSSGHGSEIGRGCWRF